MPQNSMLNSQTNRVMMLRHSYEASTSPKAKKEPQNNLEVEEIRFKYFSHKKESNNSRQQQCNMITFTSPGKILYNKH